VAFGHGHPLVMLMHPISHSTFAFHSYSHLLGMQDNIILSGLHMFLRPHNRNICKTEVNSSLVCGV
jgi:hypothetical protein